MPKIRSIDSIKKKWVDVTPGRSTQYVEGINDPKEDWKTKTVAAAANYKAAMVVALAQDRFLKGVNKVTTDKWKSKAILKGAGRFSEGVSLGGDDYGTGFAPYRDVIANTTLPPRYPKGDVRNMERVKVMAAALHAAKIG